MNKINDSYIFLIIRKVKKLLVAFVIKIIVSPAVFSPCDLLFSVALSIHHKLQSAYLLDEFSVDSNLCKNEVFSCPKTECKSCCYGRWSPFSAKYGEFKIPFNAKFWSLYLLFHEVVEVHNYQIYSSFDVF
jgi:hypothetical protein